MAVMDAPANTRLCGLKCTVLLLRQSPEKELQGSKWGKTGNVGKQGKITQAGPKWAKIRGSRTLKIMYIRHGILWVDHSWLKSYHTEFFLFTLMRDLLDSELDSELSGRLYDPKYFSVFKGILDEPSFGGCGYHV